MGEKKILREYQRQGAVDGVEILRKFGLVYLAYEVRCGKTATALEICRLFDAKRVLFLTKKRALSSIQSDYNDFGFGFDITIENHEQAHKLDNDYDLVVLDEAHKAAAFPKPGILARTMKEKYGNKPIIFLSGTMCPESFCQVFHQFWISNRSPWAGYKNFYKWAGDYANVTQKKINSFVINDYSKGIEDKIMSGISHLVLRRTQQESGFASIIKETILHVRMSNQTYAIADKLLKDLVVEGKDEVILGDTPAKLLQKMMQLYSGTIKFESGNSMVLDTTKADFIKSQFAGKKIGIFYVFKEELSLLKKVFGDDLTTDLDEFNSTDKSIALQVVSGREGITLRLADYLVFFNIQHSAVSYLQAIDRMTTIDRPNNEVFWVFADDGIEDKIYKVVKSKKKYTTNVFKKDYKL